MKFKEMLHRFDELTWAFFVANTIYALGFILTAYTSFATKSSLYDALDGVWDRLPELWGLLALCAVVFSVTAARLDWKWLGSVGCSIGIGVWFYAMFIYLQTGYYIVAGSIAFLYLFFWIYFYFKHISKVTAKRL